MNQRNRITGRTASTTDTDFNEALQRVVTTPAVRTRRLVAAGVKRGNRPFAIKAVAA
ncbi:hypothetical protein ABZ826_23985 [Streptomyces sp. NPDC047515]|uniref:hypothetical protein n=1 Tax=Streptomyces sp. NPDC047515 TaxID=3155380 RepID=UPI0033DBB13F